MGDGWTIAVLETEAELDFIREADRYVSNTNFQDYFIGGSTNHGYTVGGDVISYSQYMTNGSGTVKSFIVIYIIITNLKCQVAKNIFTIPI